jgi:hypothetical protein
VGTQLITDDGKAIQNYAEQQYSNGVAKNDATARDFKPTVRKLKNLRNEMVEADINIAEPIPSILIASSRRNLRAICSPGKWRDP